MSGKKVLLVLAFNALFALAASAQGPPGCFTPRYSAAQTEILKANLRSEEASHGLESIEVAKALRRLAEAQRDFEPGAAIADLSRSLHIYEQLEGRNGSDVATVLSLLADVYQIQSNYVKSQPLLRRALLIRERTAGANPSAISHVLYQLASGYLSHPQDAQYALGQSTVQQALSIDEKAYGLNSAHVYQDLLLLSMAYRMQNKRAQERLVNQRMDALYKNLPIVKRGTGTAAQTNLQDLISREENRKEKDLR